MPITGKLHTGTGAAVALSTVGVPSQYKRLDIIANDNNAGDVFLGGSTVAADGSVDAWLQLIPGKSWHSGAESGDLLTIDTANTYIIATASDKVHFIVHT